MKTRDRDFLRLPSVFVTARLGLLWLMTVNADDLLALEASRPSEESDGAYFKLGPSTGPKVWATAWKIVGPLSATGHFYVLMRAEMVPKKPRAASTGKATG